MSILTKVTLGALAVASLGWGSQAEARDYRGHYRHYDRGHRYYSSYRVRPYYYGYRTYRPRVIYSQPYYTSYYSPYDYGYYRPYTYYRPYRYNSYYSGYYGPSLGGLSIGFGGFGWGHRDWGNRGWYGHHWR